MTIWRIFSIFFLHISGMNVPLVWLHIRLMPECLILLRTIHKLLVTQSSDSEALRNWEYPGTISSWYFWCITICYIYYWWCMNVLVNDQGSYIYDVRFFGKVFRGPWLRLLDPLPYKSIFLAFKISKQKLLFLTLLPQYM